MNTCDRCGKAAPDNFWRGGWALTVTDPRLTLCPSCFEGLQTLRQKVLNYQTRLMHRFMAAHQKPLRNPSETPQTPQASQAQKP